jgi:ferritin-like metal-binding protein YciE
MSTISSLEEIYAAQLHELFGAETGSMPALTLLLHAAHDPALVHSFRQQCFATLGHAKQLERLLADVGYTTRGARSEAMEALAHDAQRAVQEGGSSVERDLALIEAARRIEHYEMACYGSLRTYATVLDHDEAAEELQDILDQKSDTDLGLSEVAKRLTAETTAPRPALAAIDERNP